METTKTISASSRTELENKIVTHFDKGYQPITDVFEAENGKFQIELTN